MPPPTSGGGPLTFPGIPPRPLGQRGDHPCVAPRAAVQLRAAKLLAIIAGMRPPEPIPAADQATRPPRILIADDNPQAVELLEAYLCEGDHEIRTAADGDETLALVRDWQPDLILLDIMMPKISGFEVCKRLRADAKTKDIAVLMITA